MDSRGPPLARLLEPLVGRRLGLSPAPGGDLLRAVRTGSRLYTLRLAAFLLATSSGGRVLPRAVRTRAIGAVVYPMLREHSQVLVMLGLRERLVDRCGGVVPP